MQTFGFLDCVENVGSAEAVTAVRQPSRLDLAHGGERPTAAHPRRPQATKELRLWKLPMFSLSRMVGERLLTRIREVAVQVRRTACV
jgi:hypothetical protein